MSEFLTGMQRGFLDCASWADSTYLEENFPNYSEGNGFTQAAQETLKTRCTAFYEANKTLLHDCGLDAEQCGHDLWLTIHHHGAGFWDRGIGEKGEQLTALCHKESEINLYVNSEGLIEVD